MACPQRLDCYLSRVDSIILGCTHYPFALDVLKRIWDELSPTRTVEWLDPAIWMADVAKETAIKNTMTNQSLTTDFYVTGSPKDFDITVDALKFMALNPLPAKQLALPGVIEHAS